MQIFNLVHEQVFAADKQVEKILGTFGEGDVAVACWEPNQISAYHCHPEATEIYFCFSGGGTMRTPERTVDILPGSFVVHPRGEVHEFVNGPERTLLFRVRYGTSMSTRFAGNRRQANWQPNAQDTEYFRDTPRLLTEEVS
jgi:quercetin dioxygenase-like cupin family protein